MNLFVFTGNLGNDAEVGQAGSTTVANFSVAVSSGYGDKKTTNWVRCALFGKRAEGGLMPYLVKGQQVAISGELSLREYDKDGVTKSSLEVNVGELDLIGKAGESKGQPSQNDAPSSGDDFLDDDIPF